MSNSSISEIPPLLSSLLAQQHEKMAYTHINAHFFIVLLIRHYWKQPLTSKLQLPPSLSLSLFFFFSLSLSLLSHYTQCCKSVLAVKTVFPNSLPRSWPTQIKTFRFPDDRKESLIICVCSVSYLFSYRQMCIGTMAFDDVFVYVHVRACSHAHMHVCLQRNPIMGQSSRSQPPCQLSVRLWKVWFAVFNLTECHSAISLCTTRGR